MILALILFLLITFGLGLPLVVLIAPSSNRFIQLGVSYPLGVGIFTLMMFASNLLGVRFTLLNELLLLLVVVLPLTIFGRRKLKDFFVSVHRYKVLLTLSPLERVVFGIILFLILSGFINTLYWPVSMWDSVVLYDFRGRVFATTGFMWDALTNEYYYSYPLLTSLAHTIVYLAGGKYPQFIYSFFYLSMGISFFGLLREYISRTASLFFTLLLLITGPIFYHSLFSYTNLTYTVYLSLGAILIYVWDKSLVHNKNGAGYLTLSGLLIGLSTWVRAGEPFWVGAVLTVLAVSIFRKRFFSPVIYFLMIFPIVKVWKIFQSSVATARILSAGQSDGYVKIWQYVLDFTNWYKIFLYLYDHVIAPWGPLFVLFIISLLIGFISKKNKDYFLIFFISLIFLAVLMGGTFIFSVYVDYWYRIGDATERLSMLFYPLFIYTITLVYFPTFKKR